MCLRHKDEQKIKAIRKTSHFLRCCLLTLFRFSPIILLGAYPNSERKDSSYELQKHVCMNTDRAKPMGSICRGDAGRKQVRFLCFCHKKHGLEQVAATVLKTAVDTEAPWVCPSCAPICTIICSASSAKKRALRRIRTNRIRMKRSPSSQAIRLFGIV